MNWLKAAVVGLLGALVMFLLIQLALATGMAPFNVPPSAAFLAKTKDTLGIPPQPWALVVHFGYGLVWSIILVAFARRGATLAKGLGMGVFLWLIMMIIWSPVLSWGLFGLSGSPEGIPEDSPVHLAAGPKYLIATLIVHLIYGGIIGWLDGLWIGSSAKATTATERPAATPASYASEGAASATQSTGQAGQSEQASSSPSQTNAPSEDRSNPGSAEKPGS